MTDQPQTQQAPSIFDHLKPVKHLDQYETIAQIVPFGSTQTLALLTTKSRVLIPGPDLGTWYELPVPKHEDQAHAS